VRRKWLYKKFASIKTSVWLLGILCLFFLIGTIFPQGKSYAPEGGTLLWVFKFVDVLNIFSAPLFLFAAALLFINQMVCSYERLRLLLRKASSSINEEVLREDPRTLSISIPHTDTVSDGSIADVFSGFGFKLKISDRRLACGALPLEKGINPHWPSWIFHTAVLVLLAGFAVSYLFAFEGELSLLPGQTEEVSTRSPEARWYRLREKGVKPDGGKTFKVGLEEFITEYTQFPRLKYPSKGIGRLALFTDMKGERISYTLPEDSLFPKDWMSRLVIYETGKETRRKTIEVNDPLRHRGITFYQMDIGQEMTVSVNGGDENLTVKAGEPFEVPGIEGKLKTNMLRVGTLYKKAGGQETITPFTKLKLIQTGDDGEETTKNLGKLIQGEPLIVQGVTLTLKGWQESSILSYRYDPGRPLLWAASLILLTAMTFRIWAYWYRVEYLLEKRDKGHRLYLRLIHNGLLADPERILRKIRSVLSDQE
jgi:hypothetical protein